MRVAPRGPSVYQADPIVAQLGLAITATEDGLVSIALPRAMAAVFLEDLEQRAQAWREASRRADLLARRREAELQAHSEETRQRVEAMEDAWRAEYERLCAEGKGHREALHLIRDGSIERWDLWSVDDAIRRSRSRHKAHERAARGVR